MTEVAEGIASFVEQLNERVRELERRVAVLEGHGATSRPRPAPVPLPPLERPKPPATWRGFPPPEKPAGVVPVIGKAILGIAGAYLLRAIAESGSTPQLPVLIVAILYAGFWLFWAVRTHAANRFASSTYAVTSVLILSPLLWESTVRFHVLTPTATGFVLLAFVLTATALSWRGNLQVVPWVATLASVITAWALMLQTREFLPFTTALLGIALAVEIAGCFGHQLRLRVLPAISADVAIAVLVLMLISPQGIGEGFYLGSPAMVTTLCLALLIIYGVSIGIRSFALLHRLTVFEVVQAALAFAIGTAGALAAARAPMRTSLGVLFFLLSAVSYWGALWRFNNESTRRNRRVSASWAAVLLISGSFLFLPTTLQIMFLSAAAVISAVLYMRTGKFSLGLHTSLFLIAAAAVSPLPSYLVNALAGSVPAAPQWTVWIVALAAALCYGMGAPRLEAKRRRRVLWVLPALVVGFTGAALAIALIVSIVESRTPLSASALSVVRTVVNCTLALTLGFLGSHQRRVELGWVAYTAVGFGALKLLFEDLRLGNPASLVVSLLFYGLVLILLPRLTRRSENSMSATA